MSAVLAAAVFFSGCAGKGPQAEEMTRIEGDTFTLADLSLTVESEEYRDSVAPENPEGYFDYYEEYEGYHYCVLEGTVTNSAGAAVRADAFDVIGETDAGEEDARLLFMDEESTAFLDTIGANDERKFILFMLVEDGAEPEEFRIFYNEGYRTPEEGESCDYGVIKETELNGE